MRISAIILAAGRGRRMGADQNKVFLPVSGRPLLAHTLASFTSVKQIDELVVVVHPDDAEAVSAMMRTIDIPQRIVPGGAQRRDSALAGVQAAHGDLSLIHDGARPFPSAELIGRIIKGTMEHGACIPVLPVVDTLRHVRGDRLLSTMIDRDEMVRIQTPQGFHTTRIQEALNASDSRITDDAAAVLALGEDVRTVLGESTNLKVTTRDDLLLAEAIVQVRRAQRSL